MRNIIAILFLLGLVNFVYGANATITPDIYGATPNHGLTASKLNELRFGTATITVDSDTANLISRLNNLVRAELEPIIINPPVGPDHLDPDRWRIVRLVVDVNDDKGGSRAMIIADFSNHGSKPIMTINANTHGELYWYENNNLYVRYVRDGLTFLSPNDVAQFRMLWLDQVGVIGLKKRMTRQPTALRITSNCALPIGGFDQSTPIASIPGAWIITPVAGEPSRYFQERDVVFNNVIDDDPYLMNGQVVQSLPAINSNNNFNLRYTRSDPTYHILGTAHLTSSFTAHDLPEPYRTQELNDGTAGDGNVDLVDTHNRGDLDGQDMAALSDAVQSIRNAQDDEQNIGEAIDAAGYFEYKGDKLTIKNADMSNPDMQLLAASLDGEQIANQRQYELRNVQQEKPELYDVSNSPIPDDWRTAVEEAEAVMIQHMEGDQELVQEVIPRYADMNPAGLALALSEQQLSPNKLGEPWADGDNPNPQRPSGLTPVGSPFYDFDGDGDLDRWYTDDPWSGEYKQLRIKWKFDNDYRSRYRSKTQHKWGAWIINKQGEEKLLLCSSDNVRNRVAKRNKGTSFGITYYGPALQSFLEPLQTGKNQYKFALWYLGNVINETDDEAYPPEPTIHTANEQILGPQLDAQGNPVLDPQGNPIIIPVGFIVETAKVYGGITEPADIVGSSWTQINGQPAFEPISVNKNPIAPTSITRTVFDTTVQPPSSETFTYNYPAQFDPAMIEEEVYEPPYVVKNAWFWDYKGFNKNKSPSAKNCSWNYKRINRFGRYSQFSFKLNPPEVLNSFGGGETPLFTTDGVIASGNKSIAFSVSEIKDKNPKDMTESEWKKLRSMQHRSPYPGGSYDSRTDMDPGRSFNNSSGNRLYDIIEGIGWYIFQGARHEYNNLTEQRDLITRMWDWYFRTPRTILQVQRIDQSNPASALLNTARPVMLGEADKLVSDLNGALVNEIRDPKESHSAAAERRNSLMNSFIYIFSAARGREWEIEYARMMPKNTRLVCVEYDNIKDVQKIFTGRNIEFIENKTMEDKLKGEIITNVFGIKPGSANLNGDNYLGTGGISKTVQDSAKNNPGKYIFSSDNTLFGKPALYLQSVAILDNDQYGNPRSDQWYESHKMEFRHPMLTYYDDRHSAIVVAYSHNADPRKVFGQWEENGPVSEEDGTSEEDLHRIKFENWVNVEPRLRLEDIYNKLNADAWDKAQLGNMELPEEPPLPGAEPKAPEEPLFTATIPVEPEEVPDPGIAPSIPDAPPSPWSGYNYGLDDAASEAQWLSEIKRVDYSKPGRLTVFYGDRFFTGNTTATRDAHWNNKLPLGQRMFRTNFNGSISGPNSFLKIRIRNTSVHNGGGHGHISGQDTRYHYNILDAALVSKNASSVGAYYSYDNDDGGAIWFNDNPLVTHELISSSKENGGKNVTIAPGVNLLFAVQTEWKGQSIYRFKLAGKSWEHYARDNNMELYPLYRKGIAGSMARDAISDWKAAMANYANIKKAAEDALDAWTTAHAAYKVYLDKLALYEEQKIAYDKAVKQYETDYAAYQKYKAEYPALHAEWATKKSAHDAWLALRNSGQTNAQNYANYIAARDAWVLLALAEIGRDGVNWSGPDTPVFDAYNWWNGNTVEGQTYP